MSVSSPSPGSKPPPKYMTYLEVIERYDILVEAYRSLCDALLVGDPTPATRAKVLALQAVLEGRPTDGS